MPKKKLPPLVAICGRPNVGKSTLYNRIVGKQRAIIHDEEGITRDRRYDRAEWENRAFRLVDTGGIVEAPADTIVEKMQEQVRLALNEATVIVFVVDGQQDITRVDRELSEELFKLGKPVLLAVNKLDNPAMEANKNEFYELGMGEPYAISSGHGRGVGELLDEVVKRLPEPPQPDEDVEEEERDITRIAIVGKPNVGKSSYVNAVLNEARTIVDETPGTTRDAIDIEFEWKGKDYLLIDTAGMRKKAGIKKDVERFSISRSLRAVRRADVCLLLIDATGGVTEQDKRIIGYIMEQGVAFIIVWTKWDLIEDKEARFKELIDDLDFKIPHLKYVPFVTISNVSRQRIFKTFEYVDRVAREAEKRVPTGELNRLIEEIRIRHKPPTKKGKAAKILYATQAGVKPTTFVLFVNQKRLFHFSYMRYIENQLREKYSFEGTPIKIELREGPPKK